ncbi:MAG: uracil-DNA glycosylase [Acidobacteriota bacterium]|nr:uracil-DNA glycosylase [Acidobacteriota bacterium]
MTVKMPPQTLERRDLFKLGVGATAGVLSTASAETYPEFRRRLRESDCQRCALAAGRRHIVVDRGNPDAAIIGISDAPSFVEDAQGIPFCGRAGQKLDELFAAEGLSTDKHLLLVNVVKCHPPYNRPPHPDEMARCEPFLERQLAFSPARFVVLLGIFALRRFAPERRPFSAHVGQFFRLPQWPGREVLPLHHPALLLRNPSLEPLMRKHIRELAARVAT